MLQWNLVRPSSYRGSVLTTVVRTEACKKYVTKLFWELPLSLQLQEHLNRIQWQKGEYQHLWAEQEPC